ncbi:hypothetical protein FDP41_012636 [Naegleria fowleri]|uniref:Uncharacterized protein n=1 Tax=Naegleria fowleri TaxID=5763 RepID=A0A6A5C4Q3_NAEFO|nr:uncharacterized protein FDP41_012636 [Naegleria fowleri]KAF0980848.1 hypothetical protein FDP41_012636 [Naegleria fowleri]
MFHHQDGYHKQNPSSWFMKMMMIVAFIMIVIITTLITGITATTTTDASSSPQMDDSHISCNSVIDLNDPTSFINEYHNNIHADSNTEIQASSIATSPLLDVQINASRPLFISLLENHRHLSTPQAPYHHEMSSTTKPSMTFQPSSTSSQASIHDESSTKDQQQQQPPIDPTNSVNTTTCPYAIYRMYWDEFLRDPKNRKQSYSSDLDRILNARVPLYNQTEWTTKFEDQPNALSCPQFTINKWRRYVPMTNPSEDILYYFGTEMNMCQLYEKFTYSYKALVNGTIVVRNVTFNFDYTQVCDRLFCFPNTTLQLVNDFQSPFGLNLTQLLTNTTIYTNLFPQRVALSFFQKWAQSFEDNTYSIDPQSLVVSPAYNKLMHILVPHLPFNFTTLQHIADYYTVCRACRDYRKYPISPGREVCLTLDYPFTCYYDSNNNGVIDDGDTPGYPLIEIVQRRDNIFRNVMSMNAEPLCYCPRPGTVVPKSNGIDVMIFNYTFFRTKVSSQCDEYAYFWYPLYETKLLNIALITLEAMLNIFMLFLVLLPLIAQFCKEIAMKSKGKALKLPQFSALMNTREMVEKYNKMEQTRFYSTTTSLHHNRTWKRILFDLRLYSAIILQVAYLCFLSSDILAASSTVESSSAAVKSESVLFLSGIGFCLIGIIPILAMWVDVLKKTSNNSERISLKISIPLFLFMALGLLGVLAYAISDYFSQFFASAVFMLGLVIVFAIVIFGLFIYGFRIYLSLRRVSKVNFFQFRFTKFLGAACLLAIFPGFYMVFDIACRIYQSQNGTYPLTRFYYLFAPFFASVLIIGFGGSLIYVLFPSNKVFKESYQLIFYAMFCCGGKSPMAKRFWTLQKSLLRSSMTARRDRLLQQDHQESLGEQGMVLASTKIDKSLLMRQEGQQGDSSSSLSINNNDEDDSIHGGYHNGVGGGGGGGVGSTRSTRGINTPSREVALHLGILSQQDEGGVRLTHHQNPHQNVENEEEGVEVEYHVRKGNTAHHINQYMGGLLEDLHGMQRLHEEEEDDDEIRNDDSQYYENQVSGTIEKRSERQRELSLPFL